MILSEGKNADAFYIVAKGTVQVIMPRENQSDVVALELGPGRYFGEIEFFHDHRNRASIRACETCSVEVYELTYAALNELLSHSEVTRDALLRAAEAHEQENVRKRQARA